MVSEDIVITTKFVDNITGATKEVTKTIKDLGVGAQKTTEVMTGLTAKGKKLSKTTTSMAKGMKKFKMELLSVMFFGMAITKFFSGLLQPALEIVGVFALWTNVLQILFLPVALQLLDVLMPLMQWLIDLDPAIQQAIGGFVLFMAILGQAIFLFGMVGLGIFGILQAFPILAGVAAAIGSIALLPLIGILALVVVAIVSFALAWKNNFLKIRGWVQLMWLGIKQTFTGIWQFLQGIWKVILGLFSGNTDKIIEGFKLMGKGLWNVLKGILKFVGSLIMTIGLTIISGIWNAIKALGGLLIKAVSYLKEKVGGFVGGIVGKITGKGTKQTGGFIPHTGLYRLHAGESVNQAGDTFNSAPNIIINAAPGMNMDELVRRISDVVVRDLGTLSRR